MILFTLRCASGHEFEGWFRDGDTFEAQQKASEIACPECGDTGIEKALMAPQHRPLAKKAPPMSPAQMRAALVELRRQVETNCDYVGERFAEEARENPLRRGRPARHLRRGYEEESRNSATRASTFGRIPWVPTTDA